MSVWIEIARLAAGLNVVLLAVLVAIWARNYRQFHSKHALGLSVFGLLLLVENAFALYFYVLDPMLAEWFSEAVPDIAWRSMMLLHVLELAAVAFLAWVTWD